VIRIGTRGSPLALAQTAQVEAALAAAHPRLADTFERVILRTTGDQIQDRPLAEVGGKGLFTKELDEALLDGRIAFAVHSMKDMPTWLAEGISIACILPREDPRDVLIARGGARTLGDLPSGAVLGTASLRRAAQALLRRPDLKVVPLRGNVGTRLKKLAAGEIEATLLAAAGLRRLGITDYDQALLSPDEMLPAVAQGAIAITARTLDWATQDFLEPLHHLATGICTTAERACLAELEGSCRTPIAALAEIGENERLNLRALIAMPDGSAVVREEQQGPASEGASLGRAVGAALKDRAGPEFFSHIR